MVGRESNFNALSTIANYLKDESLEEIAHSETSKEACDESNYIYTMNDKNTKRISRKEFSICKASNEEEMSKSISKIISLNDRLAGVGIVFDEGDKTNVLFSTLSKSWKSFTNINGNETTLSLCKLIDNILQK